MERIEIKLSKGKLLLMLAASLLIALAGYWLIVKIANEQTRYSAIFVKLLGVVSILFFGILFIYALVKMFGKKPGLVVDDKGITDNSSGVAAGFIAWNNITGIRAVKVQSTRFLLIDTVNPDLYIEDKSAFSKRMMKINMKMYGTPITIPSTTLKYKFEDLELLLQSYLEKYKA